MSLFVLLHILISFFIFFIGVYTYKKYKEYSGIFFAISTFCLGLWLMLYILIFGAIEDENILIYIFRIMYVFSFLGLYSMLIYVYYFGNKIKKIKKVSIFLIFSIIGLLFIFTPLVIENLKFIDDKGYYFEEYGILYNFILGLYLFFIPLFLSIGYWKIKILSYINKIRLQIIILGFSMSAFLSLLLYVILPYFGIYLFENGLPIISLPFIFSVLYSIKVYNFFHFKFKLGRLFIFLISILFSIGTLSILKYLIQYLPEYFSHFWGFSEDFLIIDLILGIILYSYFYNLLNKTFLGKNTLITFENKLNSLKKYISYTPSMEELINFLKVKFQILFKIKYVNITLFNKENSNLELFKYFSNNISRDLFINDIVFIEENKYKFNYEKINKEISKNIYLILPIINNQNKLIGLLELGHKPFKDIYYREEIDMLKGFRDFLTGHLKYIKIYSQINNLNKNLDKQVDQKTLEINNLLNKQKEFISMASHEIKTPLAGAIMQSDVLLDEIEDGNLDKKSMKHEVGMLIKQLEKVGSLVNNIFKVQKYDIKNIQMFFEIINIKNLLKEELLLFQKMHPKVDISLKVEDNISYIKLDKIQFTQVLDNLLNNSLKYSEVKNLKIVIKLYSKGKYIYVEISDNGKGLINIDLENIFDKYFVGPNSSFGIGMGLYLCKKIVSMHEGVIKAKKSVSLGGASFIIKLPK